MIIQLIHRDKMMETSTDKQKEGGQSPEKTQQKNNV